MKLFFFLFINFNLWAIDLSYTLVDLENEKIIEQKNQNKEMILASVSKLYTFFYVLNKTNPKNTFKTEVLKSSNSTIAKGVLKGDLIIRPGGDPYLTSQNFIDLIYKIKEKGIKTIKGDFLILEDNTWHTSRLASIGLEDQADNSSMGPFNFEFNRFKVDRKTNSPIPPISYLEIKTKKVNRPGLKFSLENKSNKKESWIKNTSEKHRYREEVPTRDSTMFSAHFFRYLASLHGLSLPEPKRTQETKGEVIASHHSLQLYRLIELGLEYSNNLIAEMLLNYVSRQDPRMASATMLKWYKDKYAKAKIDWAKTSLTNASGLSLENKTTSKNLSLLLSKIYSDKSLKRNFISYLSINGHSGGLRRRLQGPVDSYKVYAKTGSLHFVNNLAGYLVAKSGKLYAFSIFSTDQQKRKILNGKNSKKVNQVRRQHKSWHQQSTVKIDQLLKGFINKY